MRERGSASSGFLLGFLTVLLSGVLFMLPGSRALAVDCGSTVNVASRENDVMHRGVSITDMSVWGHNNPDNSPNGTNNVGCSRVSTLDLFNADNKQMEIGWHITPDNSGVCEIDVSTPQQPFFTIIRTSPGPIQTCEYTSRPLPLDPGVTDSMKEANPNQDGHWQFYLNGTSVGANPTTDWTIGWSASNGERHTLNDSAHSKFVGLRFITGAGPQPWDSNVQVQWINSDFIYGASKIGGSNDQILVAR